MLAQRNEQRRVADRCDERRRRALHDGAGIEPHAPVESGQPDDPLRLQPDRPLRALLEAARRLAAGNSARDRPPLAQGLQTTETDSAECQESLRVVESQDRVCRCGPTSNRRQYS